METASSSDTQDASQGERFKLIACEIFCREISYCASISPNVIDIDFLSQGLHDLGGKKMKTRLQEAIDATDSDRYAAILLGFGLCNNGIVDLRARHIPLVVPRAHDCITFFLGSMERYKDYFFRHPGTYYKTSGWFERDTNNLEDFSGERTFRPGVFSSRDDYVRNYGEEVGQYLFEILGNSLKNYAALTYIKMPPLPDFGYPDKAKKEAEEKGLEFNIIEGDFRLFRNFLDGEWDHTSFLVVEPGKKIIPTYDDRVIECV